ncbi:transcriptional regulator PadR family protein [Methanobacterium paludis]|uniref:Transcriptional regulator PadR family protein n=2 Tax=Methanobacterium paludis (strain DSM 25820 / JCM 18151 / SWAN1) TaxID=868131 RepID=F6D5T5_METPW|nr:transcriptional regulator PadR family protein [Methanobacterium paludis]
MKCCEMKGYLSFLIMWILRNKGMNGAEIAREIEKRKGKKPSPGTIYPALKDLKDRDIVTVDEHKKYSLTAEGEEKLKESCKSFYKTFYDIDEMFEFFK